MVKKDYVKNVSEILITKKQLKKGIIKAARWIDDTYTDKNKDLVLVGLLKGSIPFIGQLVTEIERDITLDFMVVSSFKGEHKAQGKPEIVTDILSNIEGKDVLLVEDIVDSGYTIFYVIKELEKRKPNSIKIITLLDKPTGRKVNLDIAYSCFKIPHKFLVGFGLDYKEKCRNYEFVGVLKNEIIEKEDI